MKTYRIYQINAFTRNRFEGNPAGVVANADGLSDDQMQAIARELNNAETAFILPPTNKDHHVWIRFFTPTTEVPVCGHATVSAHYVMALENNLSSCTMMQRIGIGILPVDIINETDDYRISMTQETPEIQPPIFGREKDAVLDALGLSRSDLDTRCPVQIASTGHSKLMIPITSKALLNALEPDMEQLTRLSYPIGSNGFFVFTLDSDDAEILTHGRMFAPAIGINEDPVTGNANGPLGAYLVEHGVLTPKNNRATFKAKQGEAMGRPGIVDVTIHVSEGKPEKVQIGGPAVVSFHTEIEI